MLTKFLSLLAVSLMLTTTNAMADAVEPDRCFDKNEGYYDQDSGRGIKADYIIYFENGKSELGYIKEHNCVEEITNEFNTRFTDKSDIETVLIFGSADNTGNNPDRNRKLSKERADAVNVLLQNIGVNNTCQQAEDDNDARCANISIGDVIQRALNNYKSNPKARGVYVFILYKHDACTTDIMNVLDKLISKSSDSDIINQLKQARALCPEAGQQLLRSQRAQIDNALAIALNAMKDTTIINDLSPQERAKILSTGLIITRDGLTKNTSVWKTSDGKFNVARLAADSIAGVVLGTAGGLITSHVVKKAQISKGFENVNCKIGGQPVASYGDSFTVGIQTK